MCLSWSISFAEGRRFGIYSLSDFFLTLAKINLIMSEIEQQKHNDDDDKHNQDVPLRLLHGFSTRLGRCGVLCLLMDGMGGCEIKCSGSVS